MTVEDLIRETESLQDHNQPLFERLIEVARSLLNQGVPRTEVVALFEALYDRLDEAGDHEAQDQVVEILNSLTGYCSPSARL